jgi:hypothetical protein
MTITTFFTIVIQHEIKNIMKKIVILLKRKQKIIWKKSKKLIQKN